MASYQSPEYIPRRGKIPPIFASAGAKSVPGQPSKAFNQPQIIIVSTFINLLIPT